VTPDDSDGYRLEPYQPDYHDSIARLQEGLWGRDLLANSRHFQWKYLENPFIREPMVSLAFEGDRLVGMRGMYGSRWVLPGGRGEVTLPIAGDSFIVPEFRSQGLFNRMTTALVREAAVRDYPFALNLSAGLVTTVASRLLGWRHVGHYDTVRLGRWHRLAGLVTRWLPRRGVRVSLEPDPEGMSQLAGAPSDSPRIRHVATPEYFRWRFRNPKRWYRFLFVGKKPLRGYLVLQGRQGSHRTTIIDWEAEDQAVANHLLRKAIRVAGPRSIGIWTGAVTKRWPGSLVERGFVPEDRWKRTSHFKPGLLITQAREGDWALGGLPVCRPDSWEVRALASDEH